MSIPILDLDRFLNGGGLERARIAETLDHALRGNGFFLLRGHGVPNDLLENVQRLSREFFSRPLGEKMKVAQPRPGIMRGYVAMGCERSRCRCLKRPGHPRFSRSALNFSNWLPAD